MGAGRILFAICLPLVVLCHNHGGYYQSPSYTAATGRGQGGQEAIVTPEIQVPVAPYDGRRCVSIARKTKIIDIPLPYLCIPGKSGGLPLPHRKSTGTSTVLVAMYWSGWRICKHEIKVPITNYIRVPTCCPGWESGPTGECNIPKNNRLNGPCLNGGFTAPDLGVPICICPPGFKGTICQTPCPMNGMKTYYDKMPSDKIPSGRPKVNQLTPSVKKLMGLHQRNMMRNMGPINSQMMNMLMLNMVRPSSPFSIPGADSNINSLNVAASLMAIKQLMAPQATRNQPQINTQDTNNSNNDQNKNLLQKLGLVNILPVPGQNGMTAGQLPVNILPSDPNAMTAGRHPVNILPSDPTYAVNDKMNVDPTVVMNHQQATLDQQQQQQQQPEPPQSPQPYFMDKVVSNDPNCKDILKAGITRCVQEAGIDAYSNDIFDTKSPHNTRVIQTICSLPGNELTSCIMAGENACGTDVFGTREMLTAFITSLGQKCNSVVNISPMMNNMGGPSGMPNLDMDRMPGFMQHMAPHPSLVPLPPSIFRNSPFTPGRKPYLPVPDAAMFPVTQINTDLNNVQCQNGGYVVIHNDRTVCECPVEFTGQICETPVCAPECLNGGHCANVEGTPMCICIDGFSGLQCEESVGEVPDVADLAAVVDDTVLAQDGTPIGTSDISKVIDSYPVPHLPREEPFGVATTEASVPAETTQIKETEMTTQESSIIKQSEQLSQHTDNADESQVELKEDEFSLDDYPLWMILSVSLGALLLVLTLTTCVCLCVKRRTRKVVNITAVSTELPEKAPIKDNIYVVGIPPPVYEVKGIPPLSYEEAKGEVIRGDQEEDVETGGQVESNKDNANSSVVGEVTRI